MTQFHFLAWPDNGVPTSTKALLEFRRSVVRSPVHGQWVNGHGSMVGGQLPIVGGRWSGVNNHNQWSWSLVN